MCGGSDGLFPISAVVPNQGRDFNPLGFRCLFTSNRLSCDSERRPKCSIGKVRIKKLTGCLPSEGAAHSGDPNL
jgi:hypothetical protein